MLGSEKYKGEKSNREGEWSVTRERVFGILGRVTMEDLTEKAQIYYKIYYGLSQRILKDTIEQLDAEVHRAKSRRVLNTGVSVPVQFRVYHPPGT